MLFNEMGGYSIVCYFIRGWRNQGSQSKSVYMQLRITLSEAFQFDWSEECLVIGGIHSFWRCTETWHLRQHEDCRGQGIQKQRVCPIRASLR